MQKPTIGAWCHIEIAARDVDRLRRPHRE